MTDEQIITALECCKTVNTSDCNNCPYHHVLDNIIYSSCCGTVMTDALSLINRQKAEISVKRKLLEKAEAEIERLEKAIEVVEVMEKQHKYYLLKAEAKAVRNFAEIIVADYPEMEYYIDNLVKEFTEEHI